MYYHWSLDDEAFYRKYALLRPTPYPIRGGMPTIGAFVCVLHVVSIRTSSVMIQTKIDLNIMQIKAFTVQPLFCHFRTFFCALKVGRLIHHERQKGILLSQLSIRLRRSRAKERTRVHD